MTVEGFEDGVDGYHDVADQCRRYLLSRTSEACARQRATKRDLGTVAAFEARRERVREAFLDAVGGLPDRPDAVPVDRVGTIEREGFVVERLVLEPLPDFHVTANCYVPDGDGPHPAVLLSGGHHPYPKADGLNQRTGAELARHGVAVLIADPPGQGERDQYPDHDVYPVAHGSGVYAHSKAGQAAGYAGANVARWFVHEGRCALDHLAAREDVDADRLGIAGTSGGGMLTAYLALVDDRPAAVAPCCWVCDREDALRAGFAMDHEQVLAGAIPDGLTAPDAVGIGVDDLATGLAPTPLCVGAARSDFFPIEGVHDAYDRIEDVYDRYDAVDACELRVADTDHAAVREIPGVLAFLCRELAGTAFDPDSDPERDVLDREALTCTPEGSVREHYDDERTLTDLVAAYADAKGATDRSADGHNGVLGRVRERLELDRGDAPLHPRVVARDEHEDLAVERVFWKSEYDPDVVVAGVLVTDGECGERTAAATARTPAVVLFEDGTAELPARTDDLAALAREHGAALAFDPRGVGATRQRPLPATWGDPEYDGVNGTTHTLSLHATLLDDSLFEMRVRDVLSACEFLRERVDSADVALLGDGVGASHALYAAAASPDDVAGVGRIDASEPVRRFRDRATDADAPYDPHLDVRGVLDCDVPAVAAALRDAGVRVDVE
ncbi:hypothetical protein [Halorubellus sp. PRR65]|uniref:S9 family peptidase n=1 Tax=Halorubellus sp. PRR65 TaxID=3098148 RepID=UPI002B257602|nr:hypothetical protein [Halorubellus sp. PRR65]